MIEKIFKLLPLPKRKGKGNTSLARRYNSFLYLNVLNRGEAKMKDLCACGQLKAKKAGKCRSCWRKIAGQWQIGRKLTEQHKINLSIAHLGNMPWNLGKKLSEKHKKNIRHACKGINLGTNNAMWKGDGVGYSTLHTWIRRHKPKPQFCEICGTRPPTDVANISGKYLRDINDFRWLCERCHLVLDGDGVFRNLTYNHPPPRPKEMCQ